MPATTLQAPSTSANVPANTQARGLPILDLRDFTSGTPAQRADFVDHLRDTAYTLGFLYLKGYGASQAQIDAVLQASRDFFALSPEQKQAIHMANSPHFRGYTAAGDEFTRGERDWREQLDVGAERESLKQDPTSPAWTRLQGPNQWPESLSHIKPALLDWQNTLTETGRQLLRALALALGQPEDKFESAFSGTPVQHLKVIHYPGRTEGESRQGVGPHKDSGCLTLLLQDTQAGLQILERDGSDTPEGSGRWIDGPPIPGTLIINIGEVLEILSNGFLRANIHQVVSPPPNVDRLSVAFFLSPRLDAELPELKLPPELAAKARGVDRDPKNPLIAHTGRNLLKGRLRSHPEVAQRFYADVLEAHGITSGAAATAYA
ncbi:2-oxoglutarate and iron-dependent oxygenase domain-containing protein [Rhodoferax sp.]|uniref:isopenicillin N synthase family dioxygenase n=1 Tax=Rhodoferax sp. TaxID=50421 RepID=UPI0026064B32|nr:2-oxoglutarate and iron-dependent oxygenase domain-containing protein [Rhodoferax sp.]MDD2927053.1 2-oxoglutarate and iron-dependent oxygenase domain-containing protein [Rhodoferax sp.]